MNEPDIEYPEEQVSGAEMVERTRALRESIEYQPAEGMIEISEAEYSALRKIYDSAWHLLDGTEETILEIQRYDWEALTRALDDYEEAFPLKRHGK